MSTKTTFKRVALVTVAALGFGLLSSVAPASAGLVTTATAVTPGTVPPARTGVAAVIPVTVSIPNAASDSYTVAAQVTSAPSGSKSYGASSSGTGFISLSGVSSSSTLGASTGVAGSTTGGLGASANADFAYAGAVASGTATSMSVNVNFTADVAGTYTIMVSANNTTFTAGNPAATFTVVVAGAPTVATVTPVTSSVAEGGVTVVKVTLKDANGVATIPGSGESIVLTASGGTWVNYGGSATALAASDFSKGVGYSTWTAGSVSADTAYTLTATGGGTLTGGSMAGTATVTAKDLSTAGLAFIGYNAAATTGYSAEASAARNSKTVGYYTSLTTQGISVKFAAAVTADYVARVTVVDTDGKISGKTGATIDYVVTVAEDAKYGTVSIPATLYASSTASKYVATLITTSGVTDNTTTPTSLAFVGAKAGPSSITAGISLVTSAPATKVTLTAIVKDQFGTALASSKVNASVSGRNTVSATPLLTDSNGQVSFSYTDAGTVAISDTVTFADDADATIKGTTSVTFATLTVATLTVSGGSKAETVAGSTLTAISAADNGPEASAVTISAVAKDAAGNVLSGVPVTFTVDKGLVKKTATVDSAVAYTNAQGKASTLVFDWIPGKQTITATSGTITGTDYLTWAATDATSARVLTGTYAGGVLSYKVVDRFGNGVKGVSITLSRTGTGFFGTGKSSESVTTDSNGTADIQFTGAASTVTAKLDSATYVQAYDKAGEIAATAVTAAVAGTTKGTGASLAPVGVGVVTLTTDGANAAVDAGQAATDAAAEATDAANAATDAANAAAEAADAATAAAQDAADAVAALSTQVTEMVNALKKQITALTNLVIKIQKKVKA
jgi:hypothetical protein